MSFTIDVGDTPKYGTMVIKNKTNPTQQPVSCGFFRVQPRRCPSSSCVERHQISTSCPKQRCNQKSFRNKTHILGHVLKTLNPSPAIRGGPYVVPPAEMVTATLFQRTCQRSNFKHYLGQKVNEALSCDIWRRFCAVLDHAIVVSSLHTCFPSLQTK